jgi:2-oxo-4-hydroxy-4-carboxy--5-ureidoimidazoline (OHCU) decarboxylase
MFKEMLMKKMLKSKMKDVPEAEQEKMIKLVTENPELFQKIATEIQAKMKEGKDQMAASMEVMQAHQEELKKIM